MSHKRPNISDSRLVRKRSTCRFETTVYGFLIPFIGLPIRQSDWEVYDIYDADNDKFLLNYAVSVEKSTFLVINAELEDEDSGARFTKMRLNEMILDSWMAEGALPIALRYLGIWRITNEVIMDHMIHTYMNHYQSLDKGDQVALELKEWTSFRSNLFLGCGMSLARDMQCLCDESIQMQEAYYIKTGTDEDNLIFYMVMLFGEEGKEEEEEEAADILPEPKVEPASDSDDGNDEVIFRGRASPGKF